MDLIHQIKGVVILDQEGNRIFSKYYTDEFNNQLPKQKEFEKNLYTKTKNVKAFGEAEIAVLEKNTIVYKFDQDALFYVIGSSDENEAVLEAVLSAIVKTIDALFRGQLEKRLLLENYDLILLTVDEIIDDGIILNIDPESVTQRVAITGTGNEEGDTLAMAYAAAKDQLARTLLS